MTVEKVNLNEEDYEIKFLEHYGVKGMKWGVRRTQEQLDRAAGRPVRKSSSSKDPKKANLSSYTPGKKKKSSGGSSSNKSKKARLGSYTPDKKKKLNPAQRAGKAIGEKLAKRRETRRKNNELAKLASRPVSDLTTEELRQVTQRLQLERQYTQLTQTEKTGAKAKVDKVLAGAKFLNEVATTGTNLYTNGKKIAQISNELSKRK